MSTDNPLGVDQEIWEAGLRCAAAAPPILPGSEVAIRLKELFPDFPEWLRAHRAEKAARAEQADDTAA